MSLPDRLRSIEQRIAALEKGVDTLLSSLEQDVEEDGEQIEVTSLDGVRLVNASPRNQDEPL